MKNLNILEEESKWKKKCLIASRNEVRGSVNDILSDTQCSN